MLPKDLHAIAVAGSKPFKEGAFNKRESIPSSLEEKAGVQIATCTMSEAIAPDDQLEMRIGVNVEGGAEAEEQINEVSVSGGGAAPRSLRRALRISSAPVPYGLDLNEIALEEEGGQPITQAGTHPFQLTSTIMVNQLADINPLQAGAKPEVSPPALAKDVDVKLPPGLIGSATAIPQCSTAQFFETVEGKENRCPPDSAVGVAVTTVHEPATAGGDRHPADLQPGAGRRRARPLRLLRRDRQLAGVHRHLGAHRRRLRRHRRVPNITQTAGFSPARSPSGACPATPATRPSAAGAASMARAERPEPALHAL